MLRGGAGWIYCGAHILCSGLTAEGWPIGVGPLLFVVPNIRACTTQRAVQGFLDCSVSGFGYMGS